MNNLQEAKQTLEDSKSLEAILNPQPKKRVKLPLQRDVNLVQSILDKKLESRTAQFKEKMLNQAKTKYQAEIEAIHIKAISLRKEAENIARLIEQDGNGNITAKFLHNNYGGGYFNELPEDMTEATREDFFEIEGGNFPQVEGLKKEIEEYLLNVKIGLAQLADVKPLIEKIDQTLL